MRDRTIRGGLSLSLRTPSGDQWDLYWTETTKLKGDITPQELRDGDSVHVDFVEKEGRKWLTEIRRTKKAER